MKQGRHTFSHGLTIVYVYPPDKPSIIQLHFGFNGVYGQRNEATLADAKLAVTFIQEDLHELSNWMAENGEPSFLVGSTDTQFLLRILNEAGIPVSQDVEGGSYSFRVENASETILKSLEATKSVLSDIERIEAKRELKGKGVEK